MKPAFAEKVAMLFGVDDDGRANAYSKTFLGVQNEKRSVRSERFRLHRWAEPLLLTDDRGHGRDHDHDVRDRDRPSLDHCASGCLPRPTTYASAPSSTSARCVIPSARVPPVCSHNRGARLLRADGDPL